VTSLALQLPAPVTKLSDGQMFSVPKTFQAISLLVHCSANVMVFLFPLLPVPRRL
jgi:hypothetical protein